MGKSSLLFIIIVIIICTFGLKQYYCEILKVVAVLLLLRVSLFGLRKYFEVGDKFGHVSLDFKSQVIVTKQNSKKKLKWHLLGVP